MFFLNLSPTACIMSFELIRPILATFITTCFLSLALIFLFTKADFVDNYSDEENDTPTTVKITGLPQFGKLMVDDAEVALNQEIGIDDVSKLKFVPGEDFGTTYFEYTIADNENYAVEQQKVNITITNASRIISLSGDLSFPEITVNDKSQLNLVITNKGTEAIQVNEIQLPDGFSCSWTGKINAGDQVTITVEFNPTEVKTYSGNLVVVSDAQKGENAIALSGGSIETSIHDFAKSVGFNIYPNPCNGNVMLEVTTEKAGNIVVDVFNIFGVKVANFQFNKTSGIHSEQLNLNYLTKGVYLLKISAQQGNGNQILIIE